MAKVNTHVLFKGNTLEAFDFYKSVFGGEFSKIMRLKDLPTDSNHPISEKEGNKIMHIALPIGKSDLLIASDVAEQFMDQDLITGNRYTISISAESKEEAYQLYDGLSAGGEVEIPIAESPWGSYFGMFADKYGIQWMIDYSPE